ncbi:DUF2087 domain-containing protein [Cellulosilyticum sp. ST5]|uniref:DUF2087 domain-containing protein n=1 Tax=Cellulosilyticum sp. ST5 TaxID=3055805 RepID=UPI0039775C31
MQLEIALFENASNEELLRGYKEGDQGYTCLLCGQYFSKGEIYSIHGKLFDAQKAVLLHIQEVHHSVLAYLLKMSPNTMGLSELQLELINLFASGLSDKEIANYLGVAGSTIRNHRYKLREKEKQAKVFLTVMSLLGEKQNTEHSSWDVCSNQEGYIYTINQNLGMPDRDKRKILENHITLSGRLRSYPNTEKARKVILEYITEHFSKGEKYEDVEVNRLLMNIYIDYSLLKRELLEYGFLSRTEKGGIYWVKGA